MIYDEYDRAYESELFAKEKLAEAEKKGRPDEELLRMRRHLGLPVTENGRYISHAGCKAKTWCASTMSIPYCTGCGCLL